MTRPWDVANAAISAVRARGAAVVDSGALVVELVRGEPRLIEVDADPNVRRMGQALVARRAR